MIKEYCIIYRQDYYNGHVFEIREKEIRIPAQNLFDAVDYCHNILEIKNIKKVYEL